MRSIGLLLARLVLGAYLFVHGAQKLFGWFGGHGLDATGQFFENIGLSPGREMAALAGGSELGGGVLIATGIADPLGPLMVASTMAVAATTHVENGPLASSGGYELALTNLAAASALAVTGPGAIRLGPRLPKALTFVAAIAGAGAAAFSISMLLNARSAASAAAGSAPADGATEPADGRIAGESAPGASSDLTGEGAA